MLNIKFSLYVFIIHDQKEGFRKEAEVNTLYRIRDFCNTNGFRPVQNIEVTVRYKEACDALKEQ